MPPDPAPLGLGQSDSLANPVLSSDAAIRMEVLRACRRPRSTHELVAVVERKTGWICTPTSLGNMAARLHRAGWLIYDYEAGEGSLHQLTAAGGDVLKLIEVVR